MRIAIEAQRIFRPDKHGMDFVILEQLQEIQRTDMENEYFVIRPLPARIRTNAYHRIEMSDISSLGTDRTAPCTS